MNGRELAFCAHYAIHRNAEQAALAAGYAPRHARKHSYEILKRPHIQEQLNHLADRAQELLALDKAVVLNDLGAIALTRPIEFLTTDEQGHWTGKRPEELTQRQMAAVRDIDVRDVKDDAGKVIGQRFRYRLKDAQGALYRLGDHFGIGDVEHPGGDQNPFEDMPQDQLERLTKAYQSAIEAPEQSNGSAVDIEEGEVVG